MPAIFDLLYREYCRARLAEMRKQLLISPDRHEVPEALCDAKDAVGASPVGGSETTTQHELVILLGDGKGGFTRAKAEGLKLLDLSIYDLKVVDVNGVTTP